MDAFMDDIANNGEFPYPGEPTITDGSVAVVWVETHITQGACAYPITSSTTMGGGYSTVVAQRQEEPLGRHADLHRARKRILIGLDV